MVKITLDNIGGIRHGEATLEDGINVVQSQNFEGKSSLIAGLRTVMGATKHYHDYPLTDGAEAGSVMLTQDDASEGLHETTLQRNNDTIMRTGSVPLTDESTRVAARLFAFIDETNPIRSAVRTDSDLTELLQAPLDVEDIDAQVEELRSEKSDLESTLKQAKRAQSEIIEIEERIQQYRSDLQDLEQEKEQLKDDVDEQQTGDDDASSELGEARAELDSVQSNMSKLQAQIQSSETQIENKQETLADIGELPDPDDLDGVSEQRDRLSVVEDQLAVLESVRRANETVLDKGNYEIISEVDRKISGDSISCWTCGEEVAEEQLQDRLTEIRVKISDLRDDKTDLENQIDNYESEVERIQRRQQKKETLQNDIDALETNIEQAQTTVESLQEKQDDLTETISELESAISEEKTGNVEELADTRAKIATIQNKLSYAESERDDKEEKAEQVEGLEAERELVREQIELLRSRKKETQQDLAADFNEVLGQIIDRINPGFETARLDLLTDEQGKVVEIALEVSREVDGVVRSTSPQNLSESETELLGIAVCLAGYHAFDIGESLNMIVLDAVSDLSESNLNALLDYVDDVAEAVVVTATPERNISGNIIQTTEWQTVQKATAQ